MPTGVKIYIRLRELPTSKDLQTLRNDFIGDMALSEEDFYVSGPLIVVPEADHKYMPRKDDSSVWLDLNLWKSYYGPGYERGDPELFIRSAEWLEQHLPGSEIYYGHDVNDENVSRFDTAARNELLNNYRQKSAG